MYKMNTIKYIIPIRLHKCTPYKMFSMKCSHTHNSSPQRGFQLFYRIYQDVILDKPLIDEGVTNFTLSVVDRATGGFTELTTDEGNYNMATFSITIKVVCLENYYGSDYSILSFCEPQDDDTIGHYTCDSNNNLVCLNGYQNTESNCTEAIPMTTVATTDPPIEPTVTTTDPMTETTVVTTELPIETTVATTDPPIEPTVATTDPPTETTVATTDPPTETTVVTTELLIETTVATTDPQTETTVATTDPQTETMVSTTDLPIEITAATTANNQTTQTHEIVTTINIDDDSTVTIPSNNVTTNAPGMEIVSGTVVGGLVVILLIVIVIVIIAVFGFKKRRQGRDGKVNHKYCYIYYSYV